MTAQNIMITFPAQPSDHGQPNGTHFDMCKYNTEF